MAPRPHPTSWRWSYIAFRFGDGATQALIALAVVLHYDLPVWVLAVTTACMNLVGVPATFLWGTIMDRAHHRRRVVVLGFAVAAMAMALLANFPPFPLYVAGAMLYTMFGVATSPAASILALQGVPREDWAKATTTLSRSTGLAFLAGMLVTIGLGFAFPEPPFVALFAASAGTAALAAVVAFRTIPAALAGPDHRYAADVVAAGQRLFERPVFMPGRLRDSPTWAGLREGLRSHRLWPLGTLLTFTGSVAFFTSYPGVLHNELGLTAGLVLLCQAPSHIVTPFAYPWAGRYGSRMGKSRTVAEGAILRLVGIPGLCLAILVFGATSVPLLLVCHALMGVSFSMMQVNGPLLLAEVHPGGKGQAVGLHHAALGAGTLLGSVAAFILLRTFDGYWVSYVFSMAMTVVGVSCLVAAHRQHERQTRPAGAPAS
ncbi:MAG: MFS transporter [Candidatus Thermoplasmatota archaeon]